MDNQYKIAAQLLDELYNEMPEDSFINESEVRRRFNQFQKMFSVDKMSSFEGIDVLNNIFDFKSDNSLLYTLIYKGDYREFGSVKSAGIDYYPIYRTKDGGWNTKEHGSKKRISIDRAIQIGRSYKNKLVNALRRIDAKKFNTIEDYESFEKSLAQNIGDDAKYIWIHKYLHMLYPDLFSEFHSWDFKKHFLCAMKIKPRDTFYGMAGQIAEIRRHMKMKDYYRIAFTVYRFFPEVGDGGICRLCLSPKGKVKNHSWLAGMSHKMDPEDFDRLSMNKWFKSAELKDHNYLFVVSDSENRIYGIFNKVEKIPKKSSEKPSIEKSGIWNPCFKKNDRLPDWEDGINTQDRTFKNSRNLIFLYDRFYNYFDHNDGLEKAYYDGRQQFEREAEQIEVLRQSFIKAYPINYQKLNSLRQDQIVYGYPESFLTMLFDSLRRSDIVRGPELYDIGAMYRTGESIWYDKRCYDSEASAFNAFRESLIRFLMLCVGKEDTEPDDLNQEPLLSNSIKAKLLSVYHPDKYLGISDLKDLDRILEKLEIAFSSQDDWVKKQYLLVNWKNTHSPFASKNVNNYIFLRTLCAGMNIPF